MLLEPMRLLQKSRRLPLRTTRWCWPKMMRRRRLLEAVSGSCCILRLLLRVGLVLLLRLRALLRLGLLCRLLLRE